jgi:hypothetical protein
MEEIVFLTQKKEPTIKQTSRRYHEKETQVPKRLLKSQIFFNGTFHKTQEKLKLGKPKKHL